MDGVTLLILLLMIIFILLAALMGDTKDEPKRGKDICNPRIKILDSNICNPRIKILDSNICNPRIKILDSNICKTSNSKFEPNFIKIYNPIEVPICAECPYCGSNIRSTFNKFGGVVKCNRCGTYHHVDCLNEYGNQCGGICFRE